MEGKTLSVKKDQHVEDTATIDEQQNIVEPEIYVEDDALDNTLSQKEQEGTEAETKDNKAKGIFSKIPLKISQFFSRKDQESTNAETKDKKKRSVLNSSPWKTKQKNVLAASNEIDDSLHKFPESTRKNMNTTGSDQGLEYEDKDSEEERWKMTFDRHHDFIVDRMSPDFGLIDKLYSKSTITEDEKDELETGKTVHERNKNLIECLRKKRKLGMLIQVLRESDQRHLVKYLENDGNYSDEFDGEWPLTEKEILTIKGNYESFIDLIDITEMSDLLCRLYATGVTSKRQKEFISSKSTSYEKNKALLEIVRRGSLRSYWQTIRCLHQSNQSHIAKILETGGVIVQVHATLECETLDEVEKQIVNQLTVEQAERLIPALQLKIIAFRRGKSIVIYISCTKEEEFIHLCKIIDNLKMRNIIEQLFNKLIPNVKVKVVLVTVLSKDIAKAIQAFKDIKSSLMFKGSVNNLLYTISDLSLELIDTILEKSYLLSIQRQSESPQNQTDEVVIKQLASVDFCWFQRIAGIRFKKFVWSKIKKYYEDKCKMYLMYKNNQQFFEEIHQISGKARTTLSTDYLRNSESANGKRKRSSRKRKTTNQIHRTAFLGPENEDSIFKDFLSSYDPQEQKVFREIMKIGGGAARIEIKLSHSLTKAEPIIPLQFEDKEMKVLRLLSDRGAVVWIWCNNNNALQKLNNRDGLKKLIEIVHQSVKVTSDVLEHKTNIDCDHLKKKIVSVPLVIVDFITELNFDRESRGIYSESNIASVIGVIDITKLKMKVYVLCLIRSRDLPEYASASTMICVFDNRSPYPIIEKILMKRFDISEFWSIVSSVKENCLYLLTLSVKGKHYVDEVLRVEIKDSEENSMQDPSKWLELEEGYHPSALSMSRDEDLMMVSSSSPIILRIYDHDARLRLSVKLNEGILKTRNAVETSNGNFIIMHSMKRQTEDADDGDKAKEMNEYSVLYKREKEDHALKEVESDVVWTVSEVSRDGKAIIRGFIPQNQEQHIKIRPLSYMPYSIDEGDLCTDSRDRIFVTDTYNNRVIVLDSYLRWIGSLNLQVKNRNEMVKLRWPLKLLYDEDSCEMIIAEREQVFIYDIICK